MDLISQIWKGKHSEMETGENFSNSQTLSTNQGSLKAKLNEIETTIKELSDSLTLNRRNTQLQKGEKETLKSVLALKSADVKEHLTEELKNMENEMRKHFAHQKAENERIQQQIASLRTDRSAIKTQIMALQRRITQIEKEIGSEG